MKDHLIKITNDCFDIAATLNSIGGYDTYYNSTRKRFEIHKGKRCELVLPFSCLDYRAVEFVRRTAKQNADALFDEIERHNNALITYRQKENYEKIAQKLSEI